MTVLIQEMSNTVIAAINSWTFTVADFTVLPKKGVFKLVFNRDTALKEWVTNFIKRKEGEKRVRDGFQLQNPDEIGIGRSATNRTDVSAEGRAGKVRDEEEAEDRDIVPDIRMDDEDTDHEHARQVAQAIKRVAQDLSAHPPRRYSFEQWVYFTKLIRFSRCSREGGEQDDELMEWDWIGEDSPMLADISEAEWVLNRLCESLDRYTKRPKLYGSDHQ